MKKYTLSKEERIKGKKVFSDIFSNGSVLFSDDKLLKLLYVIKTEESAVNVKFAVAISKRAGKSFWRNRVKRLLRVAYRLSKYEFGDMCGVQNSVLYVVFSPYYLNQKNNRKIALVDITPSFKNLTEKLRNKLLKNCKDG